MQKIPDETIQAKICLVRGRKVMIDSDLAALYGVSTKAFNQAVKRNAMRFPADFAFRVTLQEVRTMRSQIVTASKRNIRHRPHVFTEHGALMAANVLNSRRAVETSVYVVRAFLRLRRILATHKDLAHKLGELERRVGDHVGAIRELVAAIRRMADPPPAPPRRRIGFRTSGGNGEDTG